MNCPICNIIMESEEHTHNVGKYTITYWNMYNDTMIQYNNGHILYLNGLPHLTEKRIDIMLLLK